MFLSRPNIEIKDGKPVKVQYDTIAAINKEDNSDVTDQQLQNALLDIYMMILSSKHHRVDTVTPLDVTTDPLRAIKSDIDNLYGYSKDHRTQHSGWFLNPVFQIEQRAKNAGSSSGIGPMALNNVVRAFIQMAELDLSPNEYLSKLKLSLKDGKLSRIFDRNGESIVDSTSALINAFVDAVKDNYIGRMNVNEYTFDIASLLVSNGMGNDLYYFINQPIIRDLATKYIEVKRGQVGVDPEKAAGELYLRDIIDMYSEGIEGYAYSELDKASIDEMSFDNMRTNIVPTRDINEYSDEWRKQQLRYLNTFLYLKQIAGSYRNMINAALIDTGKYGISANDIIKFMQSHEQFKSTYNVRFRNPDKLFSSTFLGRKYDYGVKALFSIFSKVLLEFTPGYVNTIDKISKKYGIYGGYGKKQTQRFGQRLRTVLISQFFNAYVINKSKDKNYPLKEFLIGNDSVVSRFNQMKELAAYTGEGKALFDMLKPAQAMLNTPKFFNVDNLVTNDPDIKSNITQAWQELYDSSNEQLKQYAEDLAVYMFFITGGTDSNATGLIKTSIFDLVPPRILANLKVRETTYNTFIENLINQLASSDSVIHDDIIKITEAQMAQFDDDFAKDITNSKLYNKTFSEDGKVLTVKKGSDKLVSFNTGLHSPYVKVRNASGLYDVYRLGDMVYSVSKGKEYVNPVYYKVTQIGYRNKNFQAYAVRSDGYVIDGRVHSYLNENMQEPKRYQPADKQILIPASDSIDFSQHLKQFGNSKIEQATIDKADIVIYVDDGDASRNSGNLIKYAEFKDKHFINGNLITEKDRLNYPKSNIAIIGSASEKQMATIIKSLPSNVVFLVNEKNTFVDPRYFRDKTTGNKLFNVSVLKVTPNENSLIIKDSEHFHASEKLYNRFTVSKDSDTLYIFTDNTDRTSLGTKYGTNNWYYEKYGVDGGYGSNGNSTTAVIRGLDNAAPISTQKYYYKEHGMKNYTEARWKDRDINQFKEVIDEEIEDIKRLWDTGKFKEIVIPSGDGFFNSKIADISLERTPKIYKYLLSKITELQEYVESNPSSNQLSSEEQENLAKNGKKREKECK